MAVTYTGDAWVDVVSARLEAVVAAGANLSADCVFLSLSDPAELVAHAPANRFVTVAPARMPVNLPLLAGAGSAHTGFDSAWQVDVYGRLGTDREHRSARQFRDASAGLAALVFKVATAVQLNPLVDAADVSPLREPCRITDISWNPTRPPPGWAVARLTVQVKMRTDLSGA